MVPVRSCAPLGGTHLPSVVPIFPAWYPSTVREFPDWYRNISTELYTVQQGCPFLRETVGAEGKERMWDACHTEPALALSCCFLLPLPCTPVHSLPSMRHTLPLASPCLISLCRHCLHPLALPPSLSLYCLVHARKACAQGMFARHARKACAKGMRARHARKACVQGMCAEHVCRACAQGMCAGHVCRACVQGMCAGHVCRACVQSMCAGHVCRACEEQQGRGTRQARVVGSSWALVSSAVGPTAPIPHPICSAVLLCSPLRTAAPLTPTAAPLTRTAAPLTRVTWGEGSAGHRAAEGR
ncbi:unnamed protein product [Closterium sp. Naga37s-1]|nr:unnamed protein product [Closterium sp. Naga37s-1]